MLRRAAIIAFLTMLFLAPVPSAHADGMFVWKNQDIDIREPQQKAFIIHEDGLQDLVLSVRFEGAVSDFGWLVPLPSRPEMEPAAGPVFSTLSKTMQSPFAPGSQAFNQLTMTAGGLSIDDIRATHHDVGLYDVTLLDGGDGDALGQWLDAHGYELPDGAPVVLNEYAQKGWTLAAIKIDPDQATGSTSDDLKNGEIDPILFRFASAEPVFPLRISSLNGHPSEVLLYILADQPLRPEIKPGINWQFSLKPWQRTTTHIPSSYWADPDYDPTVYNLPRPSPSYLRDVYGRFHDRTDEMWLTKCRATVQPEAMTDLIMVNYDARTMLESDNLRSRVEAAGYLGKRGDKRSVPVLVEFLAALDVPRQDCEDLVRAHLGEMMPGQDLRTALWALGQLGDKRAEPEVRRWATSGRPLYQIDALDALKLINPEAACEVALDIIEHDHVLSNWESCETVLYKLAKRTIIQLGGPELRSRLLKRVDHYQDPNMLMRLAYKVRKGVPDLGMDAMAMAAACGDSVKLAKLCQVVVDDAASWCRDLSDGDKTGTKGSYNYYPNVLKPLTYFAAQSHLRSSRSESNVVFETLLKKPLVRDEILRQAAATDSLSGFSRAMLLGDLEEPNDADIELLLAMWSAARRSPRRIHVEYGGNRHGRHCPQEAVFDLDACAIAYALARLGEGGRLLEMWRQIPWTEADLKGEVLVAAILNKGMDDPPPGLFEASAEYMRSVWNPRIRSLDRTGCYSPKGDSTLTWPYPCAFDVQHRQRAIKGLYSLRWRGEAMKLVEDMTLDPAIQLFWLQNGWPWLRRTNPDRLHLLLEAVGPRLGDPVLVSLCDRIAHRVAELEAKNAVGAE